MKQIAEYSPFKRISDRVNTLQNLSKKQLSAYDKIRKNFENITDCNEDEQLAIIEKAALDMIIESSYLITVIRERRGATA